MSQIHHLKMVSKTAVWRKPLDKLPFYRPRRPYRQRQERKSHSGRSAKTDKWYIPIYYHVHHSEHERCYFYVDKNRMKIVWKTIWQVWVRKIFKRYLGKNHNAPLKYYVLLRLCSHDSHLTSYNRTFTITTCNCC